MGQKSHPKGMRLGIVADWDSTWYAEKNYKDFIIEDDYIYKYFEQNFKQSAVSSVKISRKSDSIEIQVTSAKAGSILGKGGDIVTQHRDFLSQKLGKNIVISVTQEKNPEKSASLLAQSICSQIEKRTPFRRAMKMAIQWAMKSGAEGIKVMCSGRLGGLEIARSESYREGKVPLQTLRADIDYAFSEALTTYGKIGVKVWVYNGEIMPSQKDAPTLVAGS